MNGGLVRRCEWLLLAAIVLVAVVLRFAQFGDVPPGLHYDEAIDAKLAQDVRAGRWAIYFEEGWGREPLYHYLVAAALTLVPDPASALRLVSGALGVVQLLAAYFLFRQLFGVRTALIGAAWIAVLFWTVSTSRAGLRNITLTTLATLAALAFWQWLGSKNAGGRRQEASRGEQETGDGERTKAASINNHQSTIIPHPSSLILSGCLLGLTLYTYQPSRVVPLIYATLVAYLFLRNRAWVVSNWKAIAAFFLVALVVALPLAVFLATHPNAETGRGFQTEPVRALLSGDPRPALETAIATLKMFTFDGAGDPQPIYNVSGRPLFVGLGSLLFYAGLVVCVVRWRQPAYAFILIWLIVTLLPNMLTEPAPFFYRAIAAQTPVAALPAIGTVAVGEFFDRKNPLPHPPPHDGGGPGWGPLRSLRLIVVAGVATISLGQTALTTRHDYFDVWGRDPAVRFQYSAQHAAIARALDASPDATPVAVSGFFVEDADPIIFAQMLRRADLALRWFDARQSLVAVAEVADQRLALPSFTPLDDALARQFGDHLRTIDATPDFTLLAFDAAGFRSGLARWSRDARSPDGRSIALPASFDGRVLLVGYQLANPTSSADGEVLLLTAWRVTSEAQPSSTAIFAHLVDEQGDIVSQDDRLGFPRHTWRSGDEFVQAHRISLDGVSPGEYTLQIGIYDRADNARWTAQDRSGNSIGDRILVDRVEVQP
jgi:4-amino-4-deoxy-L-arabinose transferase-like glycosyltransferase